MTLFRLTSKQCAKIGLDKEEALLILPNTQDDDRRARIHDPATGEILKRISMKEAFKL